MATPSAYVSEKPMVKTLGIHRDGGTSGDGMSIAKAGLGAPQGLPKATEEKRCVRRLC